MYLMEQIKEQAKQKVDSVKTQVKEQAIQTIQNIISGNNNNDTTPKKSIQDNVKDQLKNKFGWPR